MLQVVTMSPKHVVFKKVSRDKSVTVYMAKRDFVDHCDFVDPVDGIVLIDPVQVKGKKVYVMLSCTFRYGRQDMDVMGVAFRRDLFLVIRQVHPELQDKEKLTHTKIQQKLLRKLGNNAYPFFFEVRLGDRNKVIMAGPDLGQMAQHASPEPGPPSAPSAGSRDNLPCSVALQPGPSDEGKKCAVEFEVKAFCGDSHADVNKQSSVHLTIRKIQFSPEDTETFYHGEPVPVTIEITNSSNRNIKDISISVEQVTNIILYGNDKYVKSVAKEETCDSVPSGTSLKTSYTLYPLLAHNKDRRGLALDGRIKHEDTNLASSSIVKQEVLREVQGMLVSYRVVLKMIASGTIGSSDSDDMVFEEFKRAYLKGVVYGDDEESPTEA
ncbi:S-arrestin Retinal S-antigen [Collichthys lucidus]|uniref:S-arrestin n=1 Tax=Collichthys lucidus TaxID=240159 RepID=A0A4U5UYW7_COLLU|nr:S-arrestin Retinal S-antigen [Collichthys lucidus]